jgi:protein PsiE
MGDTPDREATTELRAPKVLRTVERGMLVLVGGLTVIAAGLELWTIFESRTLTLADILLMFL